MNDKANPILGETTGQAIILLVDNGSVRVNAQIALRQLAHSLSDKINQTVFPVSLQHANNIPENEVREQLHNQPAHIFSVFMLAQLAAGHRDFIVLPLFFGKDSRALSLDLPKHIEALASSYENLNIVIKETLYPLPQTDSFIVDIFQETLDHATSKHIPQNKQVFMLVDHGSPSPEITAIRNDIATHLKVRNNGAFLIEEAVMERRDGQAYEFNGERLMDALERIINSGINHITLLLLFLLPGRHAGPKGDIDVIIDQIVAKYPSIKITTSPLLYKHPSLIACLQKRLMQSEKDQIESA